MFVYSKQVPSIASCLLSEHRPAVVPNDRDDLVSEASTMVSAPNNTESGSFDHNDPATEVCFDNSETKTAEMQNIVKSGKSTKQNSRAFSPKKTQKNSAKKVFI